MQERVLPRQIRASSGRGLGKLEHYPENATLQSKRNGVVLDVLAEGAHSKKEIGSTHR